MANFQRVIELISKNDTNVNFSCFDNSSCTSKQELYDSWIDFIKSRLGNCCFIGDICGLIMYSEAGETLPHPVKSAEEVLAIIMNFFNEPATFRLELFTQYSTAFTWIFVLASDLQTENT